MGVNLLLKGIGLGAGLMYLWDPQNGRRRRSEILDQFEHAKHCTEDFVDRAQRDLSNRAKGLHAETLSRLGSEQPDDRQVRERVRSKIGRYCSHPRALEVVAEQGHIVVSGQILDSEADDLLHAIRQVRGVRGVEDRLQRHRQAGNISALQGGIPRGGEPSDFMQEDWSPATRAIGQLTGMALMANCLVRRNFSSTLFGGVGLALFLRATTNQSFNRLMGTDAAARPTRYQRSVMIHAPVEKVWEFLSDFEQIGRFMPRVKAVRNLGDGRYRWNAELPGGKQLQLEEQVTRSEPHQRLSWESVSGSPFWYRGTVTLHSSSDDTTDVHVDIQYEPPGGRLGETLAAWLGVGPDSQFNQAVSRIKPFLETGNEPHDLHAVHRHPEQSENQSDQEA